MQHSTGAWQEESAIAAINGTKSDRKPAKMGVNFATVMPGSNSSNNAS
ncbi:MAG: hypothetical protein R3C28_23030 [Pirellulaceae bacterium]